MRYLYAINKFWEHKEKLKQYLSEGEKQSLEISEIDTSLLVENDIKALVLDFDGVLNSYAETTVTKNAKIWIEDLLKKMPELKIFILSNKPSSDRKEYFLKNFPKIKFIKCKKKKPYPDSLNDILKENNINQNQLLIVDDRLATGILVAEIVGCKACLITNPYVNLRRRFFVESFFCGLRFFEQKVLKYI